MATKKKICKQLRATVKDQPREGKTTATRYGFVNATITTVNPYRRLKRAYKRGEFKLESEKA